MLATNQNMYDEVLSLKKAKQDDGIDWTSVFEDESLYKQIYRQEIIVAVMETGSSENEKKRVFFVEEQKVGATVYQG